MGRRQVSREVKLEAVRLVRERDVVLRRPVGIWTWERTSCGDGSRRSQPTRRRHFLGHGHVKPEQQEIDRLRREVTTLKAERDILKKAAAYFAREWT